MIRDARLYTDQFGFQREHVVGAILNVGCNTDGAALRRDFGAVNLDVMDTDNITGKALPVDVIGDARELPYRAEFDTVVLGEILEHMEHADAVLALENARRALKPGGRVVITIPHDRRRAAGELPVPVMEFYAKGIHAYHYRLITLGEVLGWIEEAGLTPTLRARIRYVWGEDGSGIVAVAWGASC